ncbi:hypothetical protein Taro_035105 [Colocasia esculenta]|uniref:Uncharacterized protein n=1 Tax=Colocasia esculenta TaxID=4460 RepID=A0A843W5Q0_COLES|nr:hypothetical protein [Colocasia esculenta]
MTPLPFSSLAPRHLNPRGSDGSATAGTGDGAVSSTKSRKEYAGAEVGPVLLVSNGAVVGTDHRRRAV